MRHVYAIGKGQLQHLIPLCNRFVYHVHTYFAGVVCKFFKFCYLQLNTEWHIIHFKRPGDLPVWDKLMNYAAEPVFVSFGIGGFKPVTAVFFTFQFQHFGPHPLFNKFGLSISPEKATPAANQTPSLSRCPACLPRH